MPADSALLDLAVLIRDGILCQFTADPNPGPWSLADVTALVEHGARNVAMAVQGYVDDEDDEDEVDEAALAQRIALTRAPDNRPTAAERERATLQGAREWYDEAICDPDDPDFALARKNYIAVAARYGAVDVIDSIARDDRTIEAQRAR